MTLFHREIRLEAVLLNDSSMRTLTPTFYVITTLQMIGAQPHCVIDCTYVTMSE